MKLLMKRVIEKLKPVFLLISMSLVCVGIVWIVNQFRGPSLVQSSDRTTLQNPTIKDLDDLETETVEDTTIPEEVVEEDNEKGEVLAANSPMGAMCNGVLLEIESSSICKMQSSVQVDISENDGDTGGDRVLKTAIVVLSKVTVPLELLSGVEVPDSNRNITEEEPTLKPAGEQLDERMANVLLPPTIQIDTYKGIKVDEPFWFDYVLSFLNGGGSEEGKMGVETEIENACGPDCYNASNVTPDKSNKISEFMLDTMYRYPNQAVELEDKDVIEDCEGSDMYYWGGNYTGCKMDLGEEILTRVEAMLDIEAWLNTFIQCQIANSDQCIVTEEIILIMESIFGSDKDCLRDEACTNAFMMKRNKVALPPNSDIAGKQYYLTPCKAYVRGSTAAMQGKPSDIWCAWDMSHLYKERKVNEYDDLPTLDTTPDYEQYRDYLKGIDGNRDEAIDIKKGN